VERTVAVIDIGMTNKKVAVYDSSLRLLDTVSRTFDPLPVGGFDTHDLSGMEAWFLDRLADFSRKYPIGALTVTTHGATLVCVGANGEACAPCILYTHEPGPEFQERFYRLAGDPVELQASTGTPLLSALINLSKGIFLLGERFPAEFAKTRLVLSYPQYWGYRFTGEAGAEGTYVANHSYLWDWRADRYSVVADRLGIADKLPFPLRKSWDILGRVSPSIAARTGLPPETIVTMGIHDSNASLLPHLAKRKLNGFVLNSTGTWCVLMHPQERYGFEAGELGKVVFFNRSAYLEPIKTAIFLGGLEYEAWTGLIARTTGGICADPGAEVYPPIFAERDAFILPEIVPGSGQFPGSKSRAVEGGSSFPFGDIESGRSVPAFMRDPGKAMALLDASLAIQTLVALGRAGLDAEMDVYTEGGFRKNRDYTALLAAALPENRSYVTDLAEATSFGAAMCAVAALEGLEPDDLADRFDLDYRRIEPMKGVEGFAAYRDEWLRLVGGSG
jgi:sugar (pentulose or hexulose) kinase